MKAQLESDLNYITKYLLTCCCLFLFYLTIIQLLTKKLWYEGKIKWLKPLSPGRGTPTYRDIVLRTTLLLQSLLRHSQTNVTSSDRDTKRKQSVCKVHDDGTSRSSYSAIFSVIGPLFWKRGSFAALAINM